MNYVLIENQGEISVDALTLMGGTTKRNSKETIGFFGSGNKYAIATLLNRGIPFRIFSGEEEILIEAVPYDFRGTALHKIYVNGKETQLTTSMGPQWEPWFAIREWLSNSIDEGGSNVVLDISNVAPKAGCTRFYVALTDEIKAIVSNWDHYFSFDRTDVLASSTIGSVYPQILGNNAILVYRRGIRSYLDDSRRALYQYDLHDVEINESRVTANTYMQSVEVVKLLNAIDNIEVLKTILEKAYVEKFYENVLPWNTFCLTRLSEHWRTAIGNHRIIVGDVAGYFMTEQHNYDCYVVSTDLAKKIKTSFPDVTVHGLLSEGSVIVNKSKVALTKRMEFLLKECNRFFEEGAYQIDYPIEVVSFEDYDKLGLAEEGTIYISDKLFDMGKREIAVTIIEENEHLKTRFKDCSRAFQQHFINLFISQMEERIAHFL